MQTQILVNPLGILDLFVQSYLSKASSHAVENIPKRWEPLSSAFFALNYLISKFSAELGLIIRRQKVLGQNIVISILFLIFTKSWKKTASKVQYRGGFCRRARVLVRWSWSSDSSRQKTRCWTSYNRGSICILIFQNYVTTRRECGGFIFQQVIQTQA